MRPWLLKLHLYAGLLCAPYLIIFGVSSINYNHKLHFENGPAKAPGWTQPVALVSTGDNGKDSDAARDALNLAGWPKPWETTRDKNGDLHFGMSRPGKDYTIHVLYSEKSARVEVFSKHPMSILNSLHGLSGVPNAPIATVWGFYTYFCTFAVLFMGVSGVILWVVSKRDRKAGMAVLLTALVLSAGLMIYVVVKG